MRRSCKFFLSLILPEWSPQAWCKPFSKHSSRGGLDHLQGTVLQTGEMPPCLRDRTSFHHVAGKANKQTNKNYPISSYQGGDRSNDQNPNQTNKKLSWGWRESHDPITFQVPNIELGTLHKRSVGNTESNVGWKKCMINWERNRETQSGKWRVEERKGGRQEREERQKDRRTL